MNWSNHGCLVYAAMIGLGLIVLFLIVLELFRRGVLRFPLV